MARRRHGPQLTVGTRASKRAEPLNAPFRGLRRQWAAVVPQARALPREKTDGGRPSGDGVADEEETFARAMDGVVPLEREADRRIDAPPPALGAAAPVPDDAEVLAALSDLVARGVGFDVSDTREYVEGSIVGLDPRVVRKLRRGEYAHQSHVDLHGLTAAEARATVERFLGDAYRLGHRCVLIVHGRGRNSKDQMPVLKERLKSWLTQGRIARVVLAFTTARPCDGGAGALYVLLRRDRRPRAMLVTEGAPR